MRSHSFQMLGLRAVGDCCWDIDMSKVRLFHSKVYNLRRSVSICGESPVRLKSMDPMSGHDHGSVTRI